MDTLKYNVLSFDLSTVESVADFHVKITKLLGFPSHYGRNWDAFWDAISGLVELPDVFVFYNHLNWRYRFEEDETALLKAIWRYNDLFKEKKLIEYETLFGLKAHNFGSIFYDRPFQYGYRGDTGMWDELEEQFRNQALPETETQFVDLIHSKITELTGHSTETGEFFRVPKYNRGGMSGGMVSCIFWERKAIPILISRYRIIRNWTKHDELKSKVEVVKGDITKFFSDVIVNAANSSLMGGGGVDGAIHRAAGPDLLEECRKIVARQGGCKTGEAVITGAGRLYKKIIHTVGPVWNGGTKNEVELLTRCYENSLSLAEKNNLKKIAFPCISTGIYKFPIDAAASIAVKTVVKYLQTSNAIDRVSFVCFDQANYEAIEAELKIQG